MENKYDDKTLTLGTIKSIAEVYTHLIRSIDAENDFVKSIDRFVEHLENWVIINSEDDNENQKRN